MVAPDIDQARTRCVTRAEKVDHGLILRAPMRQHGLPKIKNIANQQIDVRRMGAQKAQHLISTRGQRSKMQI